MKNKRFLKIFASVFAILSILTCVALGVGATSPTAGESAISGMTGSLETALADFNATNLGTILVAALGITVALVLAWFAYRFITKRVSKAMRKGSL